MFRYIALGWTAADEVQARLALRLEHDLATSGRWQRVFQKEGHCVYVTDRVDGVNGVYTLPSGQGVVLGRLFRRSEAGPWQRRDIQITDDEAQRIVHTDGRALVEQFWGRYVAFLPSWTGDPRVLRDPTGTLPCYRVAVDDVTLVFSWLEDLYSTLGLTAHEVSWDAVAAHMLYGQLGSRDTALEGVTQILAGELTPMLQSSHRETLRLWSAVDVARRASMTSPSQAADALRATVLDCVQSWASCYGPLVLRLSGGLDSSVLLGCLSAGERADAICCLNYHSPDSDADERHYARLAAQRASVPLVERELDDHYRLDKVLDVAHMPAPANHVGRMGTDRPDAEVAKDHNADVILTGAAGDQLFFQYRCTWPAADYLRLRGVDCAFPAAVLDSAHLGNVSFWHALYQAFANRSFKGDPAADAGRYLTLMHRDALDAAARTGHRYLHPESIDASTLPIGKFHQLDGLVCPVDYYNPYLREACPELLNPLLSQPIIELALATPTYVLTHGGRSRGLARQAFAGDVPPEIATRRSKGGINNYVATILQRSLPFARDMLLDGQLAKQGLLDLQRVEVALSGRPSANAAYMSEIHACIATEAWLRRASAH